MSTLPTVKVKNADAPGGFMYINECDFVEGQHEQFDAASQPLKSAELRALLDAAHVPYKATTSKPELQKLVDALNQSGDSP